MHGSTITVTDLFCGAGGSSTGAKRAGAEVRIAMNHWAKAIETHNTNHPEVDHIMTDISTSNPRYIKRTNILIGSPECTNHSSAKGVKRNNQGQLNMFESNVPDPAEERSRATMWDIVRYAETHNYDAIIVENVVDARKWVLFDSWLTAMHAMGYEHEAVYFNSMFAHPVPQSRDRMYVVFWKRGNKRPNLQITPRAWCAKCESNIDAVQVWKNPNKRWGKYGQRNQYLYKCPKCATTVAPYYYCAANAIDWSMPGVRIGDRKKPLKPRTIERIEYGLKKFARPFVARYDGTHQHGVEDELFAQTTRDTTSVVFPFVVETGYTHAGEKRVYPMDHALNTQSTRQTLGVVSPFIFATNDRSLRAREVSDPMPTQLADRPGAMLVPPFVIEFWNTSNARQVDQALSTVEAGANHHGILVPPFLLSTNYFSDRSRGLEEPMETQMTSIKSGILHPFLINSAGELNPREVSEALPTQVAVRSPYLIQYYDNSNNPIEMSEAMGAQTTHDRNALVIPTAIPEVDDCYFRMLQPHEVQRAMGFPDDYRILGTSREKIKQAGNAVTPPVMEILMQRVMETFQ